MAVVLVLAWLCGPGWEASHVLEHAAEHQRSHEVVADHGHGHGHDHGHSHGIGASEHDHGGPAANRGHSHVHPEDLPAATHKLPRPDPSPALVSLAEVDWPAPLAELAEGPRGPTPRWREDFSRTRSRAPPSV